jgi:hypothetical protein
MKSLSSGIQAQGKSRCARIIDRCRPVLASLPVALAYLLFQRRVTQAVALSAGIKG